MVCFLEKIQETYGLSHSVERKVELFDHVSGVLGSTIHRNHSSSLLGDVVLLDQSEDQGSHVEVLKRLAVNTKLVEDKFNPCG